MRRGLLHFAFVKLQLEENNSGKLKIITQYGKQPQDDILLTNLPEKGYEVWKEAVLYGLKYAYSKLKNNTGLTINVEAVLGSHADTNATLLAYAAFMAVISKKEHCLTENHLSDIEVMAFSSFNYFHDSMPDFDECVIKRIKPQSRYRIN